MGDEGKSNGGAKAIRVITEPGAFGRPGYMVIVRRWATPETAVAGKGERQLQVGSFVVTNGNEKEQLNAIEEMKKTVIVDPLFASFTVLRFVSETRPLAEPKPEKSKIVIPTTRDVRRFNRSKYQP